MYICVYNASAAGRRLPGRPACLLALPSYPLRGTYICVCVYVCVFIYIYIYICVRIHMHVHIHIDIHTHTHTHAHTHTHDTRTHTRTRTRTHTHTHAHTHTHNTRIRTRTHTHACTCTHTHTHTHAHTPHVRPDLAQGHLRVGASHESDTYIYIYIYIYTYIHTFRFDPLRKTTYVWRELRGSHRNGAESNEWFVCGLFSIICMFKPFLGTPLAFLKVLVSCQAESLRA